MATLAKPNLPRFDVEIFQNEYLADGAREVNAIVTVTATGGGTSGGGGGGGRAAAGPPPARPPPPPRRPAGGELEGVV
ncbi:hypothetical protein ACFV61_23540, partial [Kitasatospora sp. NPDC059817]